ncbi:MAG TPA: glycoside hydrolase family 3 C-terminal domain-containing protein [Hanamia sp.]|nr:glycoside hydrolase family 3 C-terminal domain-containing protein [Hanamia sp.]
MKQKKYDVLIGHENIFPFLIIYILLIVVFIPAGLFAQNAKSSPGADMSVTQSVHQPIYLDTHYSFRERAADLVSRMTLAEEVAQLHTNFAPAIPRLGVHQYYYWSEGQHGVNAMFGNLHNGEPKDQQREAYGAPRATSFPVNFATAMSWDPQLIYRETEAVSDEARGFLDKSLFDKGQNNLGESRDDYGNLTYWAPTVNLDRDPRWGRTDEAFGEDPYLASYMEAAFVDGYQGQTMEGKPETNYLKVASTAKHYALNNMENNRQAISSNTNDEAIRDYYTAPFRYLIEQAHVAGLMTSYNAVNGTPVVANTYLVNELAQRSYGFNGYITSDCGAVGTTYDNYPYGHAWAPPGWSTDRQGQHAIWTNNKTGYTVPGAAGGQAYSVRAGTCLNCTGAEYTLQNIQDAIKAGILSKDVIDRALTKVFTIRMRTGEFDPPGMVPYTKITKDVIQSPAHQELAEEVAENTLVLLKNDAVPGTNAKLLPLDASKIHKIVIVGNLANRVTLGGYSGDPSLKVDAVQGITKAIMANNPNATVIFDSTRSSTTATKPAWLSAKTKADIKSADLVIVFVGTDEAVSREGLDRASLAMPGNYASMIYQVAALGNSNMVLAIQSDGPVQISYIKQYFPAIVFSGYNGESQGTALANVLLGKKDPSGHLDFTWYRNDTQLPSMSNYYLTPEKTGGLGRTYMYFVGNREGYYRHFTIIPPTYPFGYGLSYSQFKISNVEVSAKQISPDDKVNVSFDVSNTGSIAGETVAQLYVAPPGIKGKELPIKKLEGFQKTKDLQPGESQHITLTVAAANLAFWDEKELKNVVYNGSYQFQVGYNSSDIADSADVDIQGMLTPKVVYVTVEPENLIYHVGETINLNSKNKWIKSDVNPALEEQHAVADNIIEAVNNDGSFVNLANAHIQYHSSDKSVAAVNDKGIVTAKKSGVATITVTIGGVSGSTVIVVKKR